MFYFVLYSSFHNKFQNLDYITICTSPLKCQHIYKPTFQGRRLPSSVLPLSLFRCNMQSHSWFSMFHILCYLIFEELKVRSSHCWRVFVCLFQEEIIFFPKGNTWMINCQKENLCKSVVQIYHYFFILFLYTHHIEPVNIPPSQEWWEL